MTIVSQMFQVYFSGVFPPGCSRVTALCVKLQTQSHGGEMILLLISANFAMLGDELAPEQTAIIQN